MSFPNSGSGQGTTVVIGANPKGTYSAEVTYSQYEIVTYNGSSYFSKVNNNLNHLPDEVGSAYWEIFVSKGDTGAAGAAGEQGPAGADGATGPAGADGLMGYITSTAITTSRAITSADNTKYLINNTSTNIELTIPSGLATDFGFVAIQASTGTVKVIAGDGVTFLGSSDVTALAGQKIAVIWITTDTYSISVGG